MSRLGRTARVIALPALALGIAASAGAAEPGGAPRVTLITDSGLGALLWEKAAQEQIGRGLDLRVEIRACRKLATTGCPYEGERPPSVLDTVKERGPALGRIVAIQVGYNDQPDTYDDGLDRVMKAAVAAGVDRVVWITLRASRPNYAEINEAIAAAARRWPQLVVADWDAESRDRAWFSDGVHMNDEGAPAFARFFRPLLLAACGAPCGPDGSMLTIRTSKLRVARVGTPYAGTIVIRGGATPYKLVVRGLPRPLHVGSDGRVTGRPRSSGRFSLSVDVTDRDGVRIRATVLLRVAPAA
jgi:hypothetical protein